jgi:hypothetical protein
MPLANPFSFEVSSGLCIDEQFRNGWTSGFNARYAIVTKHDGKTTAQSTGDELHALSRIRTRTTPSTVYPLRSSAKTSCSASC